MIVGIQKQKERYENRMKLAIRKYLEKRMREARIQAAAEAIVLQQ
jgi:hypothetical protein